MGNCCIGGEAGTDLDDDEDRQTVSGQLQEQQRAWQVCQSDNYLWSPQVAWCPVLA